MSEIANAPAPVPKYEQLKSKKVEQKEDPVIARERELEAELAEINAAIDVAQFSEMTVDDVMEVLSLTIKDDNENKAIGFLGMLSAYTSEDQINISFNAQSSSGKTYLTSEIAKLFPEVDKVPLSGASPTSFFYSRGVDDVERGAKVVSLERKILLLYEQPNPLLQEKLRALLSKDDRDLHYKMTNKNKGANRTEHIILRGFPATVFCSANMLLDEQEATRFLLLSPEVTEAKLSSAVHLEVQRGADRKAFKQWLDEQPARAELMQRIIAIRFEHVDSIVVPSKEAIERRFRNSFPRLKPRHARDIRHLMELIKAIALLNVWFRKQPDGMIVASQSDIDQAFRLWGAIATSQNLNVPPAVLHFYKKYILPAWNDKHRREQANMDRGFIGLSRQDLSNYYLRTENALMDDERLRKQILPLLENSGFIVQKQPEIGDKRSMHIYIKVFLDEQNNLITDNIGDGGVGGTRINLGGKW
ncbi:MAG: hypothetical protein H6797_01825 [Candidatus Nomurabacteria bacterium]|nr:MAG: hypothetical protein H6797_01825 [Candidatus Nomurabacteria bacterium]